MLGDQGPKDLEFKLEKHIEEPNLLDIVCVDGRWGQVVASGLENTTVTTTIVWLDDIEPETSRVDLNKYHLDPWKISLESIDRRLVTDEQIEKIRYQGYSDEGGPDLRADVRVFGKYTIRH